MGDFIHDRPRHRFNRFAIMLAQIPQLTQRLGNFGGANLFQLFLQADDGRRNFLDYAIYGDE